MMRMSFRPKPFRIHKINRIIQDIPKQISIPAGKQDRVFGGPLADFGHVIPVSKTDKAGIGILQAAGKTKGNSKGWMGISYYIAEAVIVKLFDRGAGTVGYEPERSDLVVSQIAGGPVLGHGIGHPVVCVKEPLL